MKIVSVEQMQSIERSADAAGLSYDAMMHHAGKGIADWVYKQLDLMQGVIGLIGSGNNGGDTIIALTHLAQRGIRTTAFLVKTRGNDPLLDKLISYGGAIVDISARTQMDIFESALIPGVVVLDGILGTGVKLPLRCALKEVMGYIHKRLQNRLDVLKIAVDCPSGVDCDSGEVSTATFAVDHTLTMAAMKQGLLRHPARSFAGEFHYIEIGINDLSNHIKDELPSMVDQAVIRDLFPQRPDSGHKGTFGTNLVLAGSAPYTGAAYLTGKSAYRAGCGLVHMVTPKKVYGSLSGRLIEAVWSIVPIIKGAYDPKGVAPLKEALSSAESITIGPGWGLDELNAAFLQKLLETIPQDTPILIDADGLKLLTQLGEWWHLLPKDVVLTPHPGEMAVLTGLAIDEIQNNRWKIALDYAQHWKVNLILKGAVTVIASPHEGIYINPTSDASLATAGSGDVLAGIIGGLMAQGITAHAASVIGVWVHGLAGMIARKRLQTDMSVTALDILDSLPEAFFKAKEAGTQASL
jgi:ADP-dependent NAD(P)H-hydrate dehydratase / NAD(P)H-hydrate epimerase